MRTKSTRSAHLAVRLKKYDFTRIQACRNSDFTWLGDARCGTFFEYPKWMDRTARKRDVWRWLFAGDDHDIPNDPLLGEG